MKHINATVDFYATTKEVSFDLPEAHIVDQNLFVTTVSYLTKQYEGNNSGNKTTQNGLKYPKGQKNTSEVSSIETLY